MIKESRVSKTLRARELGVSRQSLYYKRKQPEKDWQLKCQIEKMLRDHPSYGSPRVAIALGRNKKPIERVMRLFGIKARRRRGRRWRKAKKTKVIYSNLLMTDIPSHENHIWVSDFTHWDFQGKKVYMATVMDLFTRKIVGVSVYTTHAVQLVLSSLFSALNKNSRPKVFHSDNGSEYNSGVFVEALETLDILISRSNPGCPWENGYQESFYSQFKVDMGDPTRFKNLGEFVCEIYHQVYVYNNTRIHTALKMSPVEFAEISKEKYDI